MSEQDQAGGPATEGEVPAVDQSAQPDAEAGAVSDTVSGSDATDAAADTATDESAAAEAPASPAAAVEPQPAPVAPPAQPVVTPPPKGKAIADMSVEEYVLYSNKQLREIPKAVKSTIERMRRYTEAMAKGNVVGESDGGTHQRDLYFTIMTALQGAEEDLKPSMDAICWFFLTGRKGCFSEAYAFRFMSAVRLEKNDLLNFQSLLRVIVSACDPASRAIALKQIDMNRATAKITNLEARDNFLKYFLG